MEVRGHLADISGSAYVGKTGLYIVPAKLIPCYNKTVVLQNKINGKHSLQYVTHNVLLCNKKFLDISRNREIWARVKRKSNQ